MKQPFISGTSLPSQESIPTTSDSVGKYLTEIDGIRALAVLPIVLFHFGIAGFPGGFIGVDIFFVISGYLITRNIRMEVEKGRFRLIEFYGRRIRRLFPAMLAVVLLTSLASILILAPPHLEEFGASIPWVIAPAVNIHFYNAVGYFDSASVFKPLLHYWSLAVEEQFYLVWPALLLFCSSRMRKSTLLLLMLSVALVSLFASEYMLNRDVSAAFYLTPFRVWEFAIGAICTLAPVSRLRAEFSKLLALLGFVIIVISLVFYTEHLRFPGIAALPPCLGTALLIRYANSGPISFLLRSAPMVHVGRISYSMYLIHWPLAVLYPYWTGSPLSNIDKLLLVVLTFGLAELLYRQVENRFRRNKAVASGLADNNNASSKVFAGGIATSAFTALILAGVLMKTDGLPGRIVNTEEIDRLEARYDNCLDAKPRDQTGLDCKTGDSNAGVKVLLIGDSHAAHFVPTWMRLAEQSDYHVTVNTHPACAPLVGTGMLYGDKGDHSLEDSCFERVKHWEELIASAEFDVVVLAARWSLFFEDVKYAGKSLDRLFLVDRAERKPDQSRARQLFEDRLIMTTDAILDTGARTIIFSQVPVLGRNVQYCDRVPFAAAGSMRLQTRCSAIVDRATAQSRLAHTDEIIEHLNARTGVLGIPMVGQFCMADGPCTTLNEQGLSLYRDDNHLSVAGSIWVAEFADRTIADFILFTGLDGTASRGTLDQ